MWPFSNRWTFRRMMKWSFSLSEYLIYHRNFLLKIPVKKQLKIPQMTLKYTIIPRVVSFQKIKLGTWHSFLNINYVFDLIFKAMARFLPSGHDQNVASGLKGAKDFQRLEGWPYEMTIEGLNYIPLRTSSISTLALLFASFCSSRV